MCCPGGTWTRPPGASRSCAWPSRRIRRTATCARFARAEDAFRAAGGYAAEAEVRRLAAGLGLAADRSDTPITVLSGGERRRVELARILFAGSDVLLLDEPTNHLDTDAKQWLMGFLRSYRGALLVVSHDIELLDEAITRVLHLDEGADGRVQGHLHPVPGGPGRATRSVKPSWPSDSRSRSTVCGSLADAMRHQTAKRARIAKTLDKRVTRLQAAAVTGPARERKYRVRFPEPPHSGRVVLEASGLTKDYGGPPVFDDVDFDRGAGPAPARHGPQRSRQDQPAAHPGRRDHGRSAASSASASVCRRATTPRSTRASGPAGPSSTTSERGDRPHPRSSCGALLGMFGLVGEMAFQDAGTLSGGEKTKLALAQLVAGRHNLLLLDEPTNNLDPPSREAIGQALVAWPGSMVLVSHDIGFVTQLAPDEVLLMPDGTEDQWSDDLLDLVAMA